MALQIILFVIIPIIARSESTRSKYNHEGFLIPPNFYGIQHKLPICTTRSATPDSTYDKSRSKNEAYPSKRMSYINGNRNLENDEYYYGLDDQAKIDDYNDDQRQDDGYYYNKDDNNNDDVDDYLSSFNAEERCVKYLVSFLEGTTNARDQCDGIQNAYVGAYCHVTGTSNVDDAYDHDDYFTNFNHFSCCESLRNYYDEYCGEAELLTNLHLFLITTMLLLCEVVKSFITSYKLHFLPEAGGTILVGTFVGLAAHITPFNFNVDDLSFDEELFLIVFLPPIIFEAALSVDKKQFRKWLLPIILFAVLGTILSTFLIGYMVYYGSLFVNKATSIPFIDSLIFGALISSVDPVAILSVLTSLNMTEHDTVYIMVFGESLLNDGIAITLFKALVTQFNRDDTVSSDEILGAMADFLIVSFGSIAIGLGCGCLCLLYFWFLRDKLSAPMEVASFFLWAGLPYYISDGIGMSGIVALVAIGVFMDVYIAAPKDDLSPASVQRNYRNSPTSQSDTQTSYVDFGENIPCSNDILCQGVTDATMYSCNDRSLHIKELLFKVQQYRLSMEAEKHVRFVAHLFAQLAENCIFVYLGLFLFTNSFQWELSLVLISIVSCVLSRGLMVTIICNLVWLISVIRRHFGLGCNSDIDDQDYNNVPKESERTSKALQNRKIKAVLVLAGLRGAVSLALMESVPLYNGVTGEGSEYKPEMKAMTSAAIIFTVFVFGGSAHYILRRLDLPGTTRTNDDPREDINLSIPVESNSGQESGSRRKRRILRSISLRKNQHSIPDIS